ncbi:uncharacterized protein G2W53_026528 [Senna tora]|uniref:Uncharacterized protein n=1 Tax=Senna tora TaxID=362788 RepID=A0A834WHH7_9FABA|nr:uncharacterized protein G2W53_026528 [Senna tora]
MKFKLTNPIFFFGFDRGKKRSRTKLLRGESAYWSEVMTGGGSGVAGDEDRRWE